MVCEMVMTEVVADLMESLRSELVRLLGDILAPQQRLNNRDESGVTSGVTRGTGEPVTSDCGLDINDTAVFHVHAASFLIASASKRVFPPTKYKLSIRVSSSHLL